jgi:hypothetical protein
LINENFNLYNLTGGFDEDVCEDWQNVHDYYIAFGRQYKINWGEDFVRYYAVAKELEEVNGVVDNDFAIESGQTHGPMAILESTRMYKWNTWSVVYDLNNFSTELVYMQQYNKDSYKFSSNYFV